MEIKLPADSLLIALSLWRLIHLSTVKFAYSAFNTLAKMFAENPARFIHCHDTCNSWATYQAFDGLTASGRHFRTTFLMLFRVV
ncbi:hypothetical protein TNCV_3531551 [Trichonephila clavipes]|nr:hypothetical protein TNCV_3531551 [Trichonephila clavipes]